jgi:carbon-monoxide dehydrogenase medium subunit
MKPPPFQYHDPKTVAEAVSLLGSLENAKLLAGGQSLMPMLNMRFVLPDHVIDLNRVEGLSYIKEVGGALEIGAMTRQRDIEFSDLVKAKCPLLHQAVMHIGHRQTRNRGTIGGSLCHLDPAAELVSVCAAHDATVVVEGPNGRREIAFAEFPVAFMTPSIELNEIVTAVRLPLWAAGHKAAFHRVLAPARRFRHRLGRGHAGTGRRQDHARVHHARRRRGRAASCPRG